MRHMSAKDIKKQYRLHQYYNNLYTTLRNIQNRQ